MPKRLRACAALLCSLWLCDRAAGQCPPPATVVDTSRQACGLAPRLDIELALHAGAALGKPCLQSGDARSCSGPALPFLGGQMLVGLRLWRRVAIGPVVAYDQRIGSTTFGSGDQRAEYGSHLWRAMLELRWYSRGVAAGGAFAALRAGAAWMTDNVVPLQDIEGTSATQVAPVVGVGFGGVFTPYEGLGGTLAVQAFIAPFPERGPELGGGFGSAYAYGTLIFVGLTAGLIYGTGL